jgi:hypothetical protein
MALHAPSHHLPTPHIGANGHRLLRDAAVVLVLAIAVLLVVGAALALRSTLPEVVITQPETQSLVDFRAGERASGAAGMTSEGTSILLFRAGERGEP